jgi:hypothetical protein
MAALSQLAVSLWVIILLDIFALFLVIKNWQRLDMRFAQLKLQSRQCWRVIEKSGCEYDVIICCDSVCTTFFIALHYQSLDQKINRWVCAFAGDAYWSVLQAVVRQWRLIQ